MRDSSPGVTSTGDTVAVDLAPVRADERTSGRGAIRGFALLGILLLNICAFGLPSAAYVNPAAAGGATGANLLSWAILAVLADGKMRAIFP